MNIIKENPFRILGLTGNATEKEIQKQISIVKRFAEVGKTKAFDYDFNFLGNFTRTLEELQTAASKIEQSDKKFLHSLFWFIKISQFDEIAFNNLKKANIEKAIAIWEKTLKDTIDNRNYSSYQNLSTLYIALATVNGSVDIEKLRRGLQLKEKILFSENINELTKIVTGNESVNNREIINKKFIDEIINLLQPYFFNSLSIEEFFSLFSPFPNNIQKYISKYFTETPIANIENEIEKTIEKRKIAPQNADKFVSLLYKNTNSDIVKLKKILGLNNIQFKMITNKLANEIMQCSIDYYNYHRENSTEFDPGDNALKIAKLAKTLSPTGQIKDRIEENTKIIQEWVDNKESRERYIEVQSEIDTIDEYLTDFQNKSINCSNAKQLVVSCKPLLIEIRTHLGSNDDFYLNLSGAVVNNALGMIIAVVNNAQEEIEYSQSKLLALADKISTAYSVVRLIGTLDMPTEVQNNYDINRATINRINNQIKSLNRQYSNSSSSGCYIATMAYGDYNHPQVVELRKFRDEVLSNSILGKTFIRFYYFTSPKLVILLKNKKYVNKVIRKILDKFIKWTKT